MEFALRLFFWEAFSTSSLGRGLFLKSKGDQVVAKRIKKRMRDIEKDYPTKQFIAKLRRLADCLEQGRRFQIQVAGERISLPPTSIINIEHERSDGAEEIEFQLKWTPDK